MVKGAVDGCHMSIAVEVQDLKRGSGARNVGPGPVAETASANLPPVFLVCT